MGIIAWLIFGALVGWLASIIMKTNARMGAGANIIVGIIGSFIGGYLSTLTGIGQGGVSGFNIGSILLGVVGACVLIFIVQMLTGRR